MRAWRNFRPLLPHEKPEPNSTDIRVGMGLTGLNSAISRRIIDIKAMSNSDARLAARYSVNELNGFSPWMAELAAAQPSAVTRELLECIDGEWQFPPERERVHEVIADLQWHGEGIAPLIVPGLVDRLLLSDPLNVTVLEQALYILLRFGNEQSVQIADLASERVLRYNEASRHFVLWIVTWIDLDSARAVPFLRETTNTSDNPKRLMVRICSELRGERAGRTSRTGSRSYTQPEVLRQFIPLVYTYVHSSEDIDRVGGGVYSPDERDHAQEFRDSLLTLLANAEAPGSERVLVELADDAAMAGRREWILHLLDERRSKLADADAWTPSDIRAFAVNFETAPRNDGDLFEIAIRRLNDIKDRLESGDDSPRHELRVSDEEPEFRAWLARKLRDTSRNQYTIPEEEQIALGHPDMRFERPGIGPVSAELKWAHRWSATELLERLENQLVGQYMRAANARFGVYVVGRIFAPRQWRHGGQELSFTELIGVLQTRADQIRFARPLVLGLRVIGLDFVDPT
jgi:hypothetical protein